MAEQFTPDNHHADMVRFEIMKQFGYFVTESSEHSSEYYPWFIKRTILSLSTAFTSRWMSTPRRCRDQIARWKQQAEHLVHNENLTHTRSSEYAAASSRHWRPAEPLDLLVTFSILGLLTTCPSMPVWKSPVW